MIGRTFSHYRITSRIGGGGMGEVFKAEDLELSRPVALKFLSPELTRNKFYSKRFVTEARAASALDHPNVCTIYEIREAADGRMFIAMAYYEGKTLQARMAGGPLPLDESIAYALMAADGLEHAHRRGIVHRDIKPANIMVTDDGVVKILDFGVAKLAGQTKITSSSKTMGTLAYMSPEQTQAKCVDHRTDIFSLGVMLYELVTGANPFRADNDAAIVYKIVNVTAEPMKQTRADVPERLERIVAKALAKDPDQRYRTMGELRDDLRQLLRQVSPGRAGLLDSMRGTSARDAGKTRVRTVLAIVAVIAGIVALATNWDAVRGRLGFGGAANSQGIAVLPLDGKAAGARGAAFASGLGEVLTERVNRLTRFDRDLWAVPFDRVVLAAVTEPPQAKRTLGVGSVIKGTVAVNPGGYSIRLHAIDAGSNREVDGIEVTTGSPTWHQDLVQWIARAVDVEMNDEQRQMVLAGDSKLPEAFQAVVVGLGYLVRPGAAAVDSAIAAFDEAVLLDSLSANVHTCRARALFQKYDAGRESRLVGEALASCRRALALDSSQADAYVCRGRVLSSMGEDDEAVAAFESALRVNDRDPAARRNLASIYFKLGQREKAEEVYDAAVSRNPGYWGAWEDLGYFHYATGKYDDAITDFQRVAELAPDYAGTYNYLGGIYFAMEDWDKATSMFEKSFALEKSYAACSNLGTLYYMQGRFADAARIYEWAREYDRTNHLVTGNLAAAYYWIPEERARAMPLFEHAIDLARPELERSPNDPVLLSIIAGYYSVLDRDSAVAYAERALAAGPDNAEALFRSAMVYEQLRERTKALVLLGDAITHGYSRKIIANERQFLELREDTRYRLLIAQRPDSTGS